MADQGNARAACNDSGGDAEKEAAMQTAAELIDAATALGAEIRANRFSLRGLDLVERCENLVEKMVWKFYEPRPKPDPTLPPRPKPAPANVYISERDQRISRP